MRLLKLADDALRIGGKRVRAVFFSEGLELRKTLGPIRAADGQGQAEFGVWFECAGRMFLEKFFEGRTGDRVIVTLGECLRGVKRADTLNDPVSRYYAERCQTARRLSFLRLHDQGLDWIEKYALP